MDAEDEDRCKCGGIRKPVKGSRTRHLCPRCGSPSVIVNIGGGRGHGDIGWMVEAQHEYDQRQGRLDLRVVE